MLIIEMDDRERNPLKFYNFPVNIVKRRLPFGDIRLFNDLDLIVERKSLIDLASTLTGNDERYAPTNKRFAAWNRRCDKAHTDNWNRFLGECERMSTTKYKYLVIECSKSQIKSWPLSITLNKPSSRKVGIQEYNYSNLRPHKGIPLSKPEFASELDFILSTQISAALLWSRLKYIKAHYGIDLIFANNRAGSEKWIFNRLTQHAANYYQCKQQLQELNELEEELYNSVLAL